jgi:O-methyltransferase
MSERGLVQPSNGARRSSSIHRISVEGLLTFRPVKMRIPARIKFALEETRFRSLWRKYSAYTMVSERQYCGNLRLAANAAAVQGNIVECGTWRGGMIAGIAEVIGGGRGYYLCDSFEGLPPAQGIDGVAARSWQANTSSPDYYDNCTASEEEARSAMAKSKAKDYTIVKGWFHETLPNFPQTPIALLRMDADWYESTKCILDNLACRVVRGGLVIIDDYYTWEGCTLAVNEYAAQHKWQIRQSCDGVCYVAV